jgi:hypothetical protein
MLKYFHVYECRTLDEQPMCKALLCVGKVPSKPIAYAWVDTIARHGELTITPVEHANEIPPHKIMDAINALCGTSLTSQDELIKALHVHLFEKANAKLQSRENWYTTQGRQYRTTHFATIDAALASEPHFPLINLPQRLHAERENLPFDLTTPTALFEQAKPSAKWTWEDYREIPQMREVLEAHAFEGPYERIDASPTGAGKKKVRKQLTAGTTRSPKMRLKTLLELIEKTPRSFISDNWKAQVTRWFDQHPAPLKGMNEKTLAQMDYDERGVLMAEQLTWLHQWYAVFNVLKKHTNGLSSQVSQFTWENNQLQKNPWPHETDQELIHWAQEQLK